MKRSSLLFTIFLMLIALRSSGQTKNKQFVRTDWVCLEPVIPIYSNPERKVGQVVAVARFMNTGRDCQIAVPVSEGEKIQIDSNSIRAAEGVEMVLMNVEETKEAEWNRKWAAQLNAQHPKFPQEEDLEHNEFNSELLRLFNSDKDGARARFCALYPRAYAPLLDWHGATEPKPCSDQAPRL